MTKLATIQLDVDSFGCILDGYGYKANKSLGYKTIYQTAIPRFLDLFERYNLKATFFVVGEDALVPENREMIMEILRKGHEIANHTMSHFTKPAFSSLARSKKNLEIEEAEEAIFRLTKIKPVGFKAPAYSITNGELFDILEERGYLYDSSVCPILFTPAIKLAQYLLTGQVRQKGHWGGTRNVFAPSRPYHPSPDKIWKEGNRKIVEVPVSTMPFFRIPFHTSIVYALGLNLFKAGYSLTKLTNNFLNYQFHAFELIDYQEINPKLLSLRPGSTKPLSDKKHIVETILARISGDYQTLLTKDIAKGKIQ